jgi:hypothetical protein
MCKSQPAAQLHAYADAQTLALVVESLLRIKAV